MVVRDFRVGNTILSAYAFGLNAQQFEVLEGVNDGSKLLYTIDQYPLNLIKVKIESQNVIDNTDPANPITLTEFPFDLAFAKILEGAEGLIIVDNSATTKLRFEPTTIQIDGGSNLSIRENGNTVLRFVYENGIFHVQSDYKPISVNLNKTIELNVDNSDVSGNSFISLTDCVKYILVNGRVSINKELFQNDRSYESVLVNVHYGNGEYNEALYLPLLESTGVTFTGISSNEGLKPVINATNISNQFERTVVLFDSRNITLKNLHFKRNDRGSVFVLATRNSSVKIINCTFENGSLDDPKGLFQAASSSKIGVHGKLEIISASGNEDIFMVSSSSSSCSLKNIVSVPGGNRNAGLEITVNTPITWKTMFRASGYASIKIDDYLDGNNNAGTPNYNPGSILYHQLAHVTSGAKVTNNSLIFPG